MTLEGWLITILTGLLINIVTGWVTYLVTSRIDREKYEKEIKKTNASIAEIAVNHIHGSYLGSKRLRLDVLSHLSALKKDKIQPEVFAVLLDGIARGLEQERISMLANIKSWKDFLDKDKDGFSLLESLKSEDYLSTQSEAKTPLSAVNISNVDDSRNDKQIGVGNRPLSILEKMKDLSQTPQERLLRAVVSGDASAIRKLKENISIYSQSKESRLALAGTLALIQDPVASDIAQSAYADYADTLALDEIKLIVGITTKVAHANNSENEALTFVTQVTEQQSKRTDISDTDKAWFLNQLQRLLYATKKYAEAIEVLNKVISLNPDEPSYYYNIAGNYQKLDDYQSAADAIKKCLSLSMEDPSYLRMGLKILNNVPGEEGTVAQLSAKLSELDPFEAAIAEFDS